MQTSTARSESTFHAGARRRTWLKSAGVSLTTAIGVTALQACGGANAADDRSCDRDRGFPAFFDQAPTLTMRDPFAQFLGAASDGVIRYAYADAVRMAGHSCPAVAGTYLMTLRGLRALYGAELPERGGIDVAMRDAADSGVTGVYASVLQLLTGAAPQTGYPGMGPGKRFSRQDLLTYGAQMDGVFAMRRRDSGRTVQLRIDHDTVPATEEMKALMPKAIANTASAAELQRFAQLWQERVRKMLIEHADDPKLIQLIE